MPRYASEKLKESRREEIIDACEKLYRTMSFREITMKEIGEATSFTRPSLYNYFHTKEEIFLALFAREYDRWTNDVDDMRAHSPAMTAEEFADGLSRTLGQRGLLLKLLSMNLYDMEANSREQNLALFKESFGKSIEAVGKCLDRLVPALTDEEKSRFIYSFFPFMYGIYPYTSVTEKQKKAMEAAGVPFVFHTVYELSFITVKKLLER